MITGPRVKFLARVLERGYMLEEVQACIVHDDGTTITVDESHPAYPREPEKPSMCRAGSELKSLLGWVGLKSGPACKCNQRARRMDRLGCDWCEQNLDVISGWLEEEAKARGLPYSHTAGKALVGLAIRRARKKMSKAGDSQT